MPAHPHEVLGVQLDASAAEIRTAFKRLALKFHPDKVGGSAERFREIAAAYEALASRSSGSGGGSKRTFNWAEIYKTALDEELTSIQTMRKACLEDDAETVTKLLSGADGRAAFAVNAVDEAGLTALKYACMAGSEACATLLIDSSASVDQESSAGVTALFEACRAGQESCVRLLIKRGASVNHANHTGHTPLMFAVISRTAHLGCVGVLCAHGASRDARTYEEGLSAADYARKLRRPPQLAAYLDGTLDCLS